MLDGNAPSVSGEPTDPPILHVLNYTLLSILLSSGADSLPVSRLRCLVSGNVIRFELARVK